jgi:hypothetical protein
MLPEFRNLGKILIFTGIILVMVGAFLFLGAKIPLPGKLPGDILVKKKNLTF